MDSIPVISQDKSLVQVSLGDAEGARITHDNFSRQCPGISQVCSAVEAIGGNEGAARQTQMQFVGNFNNFVDSVPVVGHTKGAIHYIAGDNNGGDNAMKAASRTAGAMAAGAVGFLVGGPAGAVAGGMAGGAAMDGIITGVDSGVHDQYPPYGIVEPCSRSQSTRINMDGTITITGIDPVVHNHFRPYDIVEPCFQLQTTRITTRPGRGCEGINY